jgi:dienelactone hydrolase
VLRFINKSLDRFVIREVAARFRPPIAANPRIEEAAKLLEEPGFFGEAEPPELRFQGECAFSFQSPIATASAVNNTVYGHIYRAGEDWRARTSVVLLHGWNGEKLYKWLFPWIARRLNRAGVNVAMFYLPFHGVRKPEKREDAARNFISSDLFHTVEAARQGLADARVVIGWLLAQGSPTVGVWGISLGGWLAGLLACHDKRLSFSVLQVPLVELDAAIRALPFCKPIRQGLRGRRFDSGRLNLASWRPLTALDKTLMVECRDDEFIAAEDVEAVWRAWGEPVIWRLPYGHISVLLSRGVTGKIVGWIGRQ